MTEDDRLRSYGDYCGVMREVGKEADSYKKYCKKLGATDEEAERVEQIKTA